MVQWVARRSDYLEHNTSFTSRKRSQSGPMRHASSLREKTANGGCGNSLQRGHRFPRQPTERICTGRPGRVRGLQAARAQDIVGREDRYRPSDKKMREWCLHKEGLSYGPVARNVGLANNTVMDIARRRQ